MQLLRNRYFEVLVDHKAIEYMIMHDAFHRFSCFLCCRARSVRWFGGIVVRGCALRSLLGSYVHQK